MIRVAVALLALTGAALADPKGVIPPDVLGNELSMKWFQQPRIKGCCSTADGYAIAEYTTKGDHYVVPNPEKPGEFIDVPPWAVVYDEGNPTGYAWLWLYPEDFGGSAKRLVRCFVPNSGI